MVQDEQQKLMRPSGGPQSPTDRPGRRRTADQWTKASSCPEELLIGRLWEVGVDSGQVAFIRLTSCSVAVLLRSLQPGRRTRNVQCSSDDGCERKRVGWIETNPSLNPGQ